MAGRPFTRSIQNANLTRPEARSGFGIVDGLTFLREHRLNAWCFKNLPANTVPKIPIAGAAVGSF